MRDTPVPKQGMRVTWIQPQAPITRDLIRRLARKYGKDGLSVESAEKGYGRNWKVTLSRHGFMLREGGIFLKVEWSHLRRLN